MVLTPKKVLQLCHIYKNRFNFFIMLLFMYKILRPQKAEMKLNVVIQFYWISVHVLSFLQMILQLSCSLSRIFCCTFIMFCLPFLIYKSLLMQQSRVFFLSYFHNKLFFFLYKHFFNLKTCKIVHQIKILYKKEDVCDSEV